MSNYASVQGRVFLGKRDPHGNPIEVRSPGNVAELKLSLKTDVLEHYESQSGQRMLDHRMVKQKSATIKLTSVAVMATHFACPLRRWTTVILPSPSSRASCESAAPAGTDR